MLGLIGKKIGMTQVFDEVGILVPVSVIKIEPNVVVGERTQEKNGYKALLIGAYPKKEKKVTRPYKGQFPEGTSPTKYLKEFKDVDQDYKIGEKLGVDLFNEIRYVDVKAVTKGKGYQGVMRRHGFSGGRKSHGSKFHRAPGSTGMAAWPSRVFKGTRMPGRMGYVEKTIQNLKIVRVDQEKGLLLVKGAIPGTRNNIVIVSRAKKR